MRRIVPVRYILHAMRARGRESTHTAAHSTWATHALADGGTRARGASGARARLRASERAPSARQQQQQAEDLELLPHVEADCRELEEGVEKVTARLGRGEARALPAHTLPRAREGHARAGAAPDHVLHDGENVSCAILSSCSINTGVLLMSGAPCALARPRKFIAATTVPLSRAAPPPPQPGPSPASTLGSARRGAKHHIIKQNPSYWHPGAQKGGLPVLDERR